MDSQSISEVSFHSQESDVEVSREEYLSNIQKGQRRKRLPFLMRRKKGTDTEETVGPTSKSVVEGARSVVSHITENSHETVKVSNKTLAGKAPEDDEVGRKKGNWKKLKRIIGANKANGATVKSSTSSASRLQRGSSHLSDDEGNGPNNRLNRRRVRSADEAKSLSPTRVRSSPVAPFTSPEQAIEDQSIWNRLDGVDHMSLGGARRAHFHSTEPVIVPHDWDVPDFSFTGRSVYHSPKRMFADMLWNSDGAKSPTVVLDGFLPGVDDRWNVQIDPRRVALKPSSSGSMAVPGLKSVDTDEYDTEDSCPASHALWDSLWGADDKPANTKNLEQVENNEDALLQLASECSIPIDLDEDTFIISTRDHLLAVQEIAALPLSQGQFSTVRDIFDKLLKGVGLSNQKTLRFLKGTVLHNIGVIACWEGKYDEALGFFEKAITERQKYLPENHPDTVVSLARKGLLMFALGRFDESLATLESALDMVTGSGDLVKAKILNNMGVVRYCQRGFAPALQNFTSSLEIIRQWLGGSVRRPTIVCYAATTLGNMGRLYLEGQDYDLSCFVYEEALLLYTTIFRQDDDMVLESLTSLVLAKAKAQHVKKALQIIQGCSRSQTSRFGANSAPVVESAGIMGFLYAQQGLLDDGLKCLHQVKMWQTKHLHKNHVAAQKTAEAVGRMEEIIGKTSNSGWI